MIIDKQLQAADLKSKLDNFWLRSGEKILSIENKYDDKLGAPVFTIDGSYTSRGWTEWTQGFQYGAALIQYDITGDQQFLAIGRNNTVDKMAPHLTHIGVHDHGFNNLSTYGNLLRLMVEGKVDFDPWERHFYQLALKVSGAVQASRWTNIKDGGFIYSFNGPHSLFVDTIRSCRMLVLSHLLHHDLIGENDEKVNLLERAMQHMVSTAKYSIFYGDNRDDYDEWGRTAHESIFNTNDGSFRSSSTQQGYSGYSTWTRGLAWAICGFAEQLELLDRLPDSSFSSTTSKNELMELFEKAAKATSDFYIKHTPTDGIPYWDTSAPGLTHMGDYLNNPSDPFNDYEPIDSSAAAIAAQGLLRLGKYLTTKGNQEGNTYFQAGLGVANTLFSEPYISNSVDHQGLLLHSVYHKPNGWDHIPKGQKIPCNESSMWGDYHARELALYLARWINNEDYYAYFNCLEGFKS